MRKLIAALLALVLAASVPDMILAESAPEPVLRFEQQQDISSRISWTVYDSSGPVENYHRGPKELIVMPAGNDYTRLNIGVLTFRGNAFRQNAAAGSLTSAPSLRVIWQAEGSSPGWTGQPVILRWSKEVRADSALYEEMKNKQALKEVAVPGADGSLLFLDLESGEATRSGIRTGGTVTGTPCSSPSGYPYLGFSVVSETPVFLQYNMYNTEKLLPRDAGSLLSGSVFDIRISLAVISAAGSLLRAFDRQETPAVSVEHILPGSPLIDRISDTMVTAGEDGMLYLISLNTYFDYRNAGYRIDPSVTAMKSAADGEDEALTAVRAPVSMYNRYAFYADMGGILRCVDTDTLSPVWMAETGDSVVSAVALDLQEEDLSLYAATVLNVRNSGTAQVRRFNALNGTETWCMDIGVDKSGNETYSGFVASPVIGTGPLNSMVYFTVTGLNEEGRKVLGLSAEAESALIALDKANGAVCWARPFTGPCVSSPVGVYDQEGNGWIIQCTGSGTIVLLDGLTGEETASLSVDGEIVSSPAVYNSFLIVCTAGTVYGIHLGQET